MSSMAAHLENSGFYVSDMARRILVGVSWALHRAFALRLVFEREANGGEGVSDQRRVLSLDAGPAVSNAGRQRR